MKPQELIAAYLAGELQAAELAEFERNLAADPSLRIELEDLRAMWQGLGLIPGMDSSDQPSAALRARFYQKLNAIVRPVEAAPARQWFRLPRFAFHFAAAAALLVAGIYIGLETLEITQLRTEVRTMRETVALSMLDRQSANARLEGVSLGGKVDRPGREVTTALLSALNHDSNVNVRLSSVDALQNFAEDPAIRTALIDALPLQDSPLVQISLIDVLVQLHDQNATTQLHALTQDPHVNVNVRQRAKWALQKLQTN